MWSSFIIHRNVTDGDAVIGLKMEEEKLFWRLAKSSDGVLLEQLFLTPHISTPRDTWVITEGT